jgi:hypothetical protein
MAGGGQGLVTQNFMYKQDVPSNHTGRQLPRTNERLVTRFSLRRRKKTERLRGGRVRHDTCLHVFAKAGPEVSGRKSQTKIRSTWSQLPLSYIRMIRV